MEAGIGLGWEHYVDAEGAIVRMESFGPRVPDPVHYERVGVTADEVAARGRALLAQKGNQLSCS